MFRFVLLVLALIAVASAQFVYPGLAYTGYGSAKYAVPSAGGGYSVHGASPHYGGVTYW